MIVDILGINQEKINLFPTSRLEEITQNIKIIITTVMGTVPLDRNFGIDSSFLDNPEMKAVAKARVLIVEAIRKFEPRVDVASINFVADEVNYGKIIVKVGVEILND